MFQSSRTQRATEEKCQSNSSTTNSDGSCVTPCVHARDRCEACASRSRNTNHWRSGLASLPARWSLPPELCTPHRHSPRVQILWALGIRRMLCLSTDWGSKHDSQSAGARRDFGREPSKNAAPCSNAILRERNTIPPF